MPLPTSVRTRLIDTVNVMFSKIGTTNGTTRPETKNNRAPIAWELWVSSHLASVAKGRYEQAKKAALNAGIIFDHFKTPHEPGYEHIYEDDVVEVWLKVNKPSRSYDVDKLCSYLIGRGVSKKAINEALVHASTQGKAAHTFTASLIVTPE